MTTESNRRTSDLCKKHHWTSVFPAITARLMTIRAVVLDTHDKRLVSEMMVCNSPNLAGSGTVSFA
jgi:hypothetical protein